VSNGIEFDGLEIRPYGAKIAKRCEEVALNWTQIRALYGTSCFPVLPRPLDDLKYTAQQEPYVDPAYTP